MESIKDEIFQGDWEMNDASEKTRAQSMGILAHGPAPATDTQTHCSARRYDFEIPFGRRSNF